MKDKQKTKNQLINELEKLRHQIAELEACEIERKQAEDNLRQSERELTIRNKIAHIFLTTPDDEMYGKVLQVILEAVESKYGAFGYIDEDGAFVCPSLTRDVWERCEVPEKNIVFPPETWGGIWGRALKEKKTICSNKSLHVPKGHIPIFKAMDVPIVHQGEVIGNLLVGNKETDYRKKEKKLLEAIVGYIAPVLNARLQRDRQERARKQAEEALRESEEKYRTLVEHVNDGIAIIQDGLIKYANQRLAEIRGCAVEGLTGAKFTNYLHHDELTKVVDYYNRRMSGKDVPSIYESAIKHKDGHKVLVEFNANITNYQGKPADLVFVRDITERKMVEEKIKIYQGKLKSLASRMSLAEEKERRRIAAMLHDNLGQKLALAKVKLGVLREPLSAPDLVKSIDEIRELIQETIQDTSSLTFELSPPILYELGLAAAVEWLTEQIQDKYNIQTDFKDDGQPKPLSNDIRVALFQAVRELLINAAKHSKANKVKVSSHEDGKNIRISIEDNGVGFKVSKLHPYFSKTGGFGLFNIHERLEQIGGHMEIESKPGRGTRVALVAPLEGGEKISKQK